VKIAPGYSGITVYVPDASRSVSVASQLLSDTQRDAYIAGVRADYEKVREQHAQKKGPQLVPLAERAPTVLRPTGNPMRRQSRHWRDGAKLRNVDLNEIAAYIDWSRFFQTWDLAGSYPAILKDEIVGRCRDQGVCRRQGDAEKKSSKAAGSKQWRLLRCIRQQRRRQYRDLCRRVTQPRIDDVISAAPAEQTPRRQAEITVSPTLLPPRIRPDRLHRCVAVTAASAPKNAPRRSRTNTTTTTPSWVKAIADRLAEAFAEYLQ